MASRTRDDPANDDRSGRQKIRARHGRIPEDEEARHRDNRARLRRAAVMTAAVKATPYGEKTITLTRVFDAPRALVWRAWTEPKMMAQWFGPRGFTSSVPQLDVRVGGALRIVMHGPDGNDYPMKGVFREVVAPERLVFSNIAIDNNGNHLL